MIIFNKTNAEEMDSGLDDVVETQSSCNAIPTNARHEQESSQECDTQHLSTSSRLTYGANSGAKSNRNSANNEDAVRTTTMERSFMIIDKHSGTFVTELTDNFELEPSVVSKSDMKEFKQNASDFNDNYSQVKTLDDHEGNSCGFDSKMSPSLSSSDDSPFDGNPVVSFGSQHEIVALYQGTSSKTSNFKKRSGSFGSQIITPMQAHKDIPDHPSIFDLEINAEKLFPFFDDDDTPSSTSGGGLEFDVFDSQISGNSQSSDTSSWSNTPFCERPLLTDDDFQPNFHRTVKVTDLDALFMEQNVSQQNVSQENASLEEEEDIDLLDRNEANEGEKQNDKTTDDETAYSDHLFELFAKEIRRKSKRKRNIDRLSFNSNGNVLDDEEVISPEESPREDVNLNNLFLEDCANEETIVPIVVNKKYSLFEDFLLNESNLTTQDGDVECAHNGNFPDSCNVKTASVSAQYSDERRNFLDDKTTEKNTDISVNDLKMNTDDVTTACHSDNDENLDKNVDKGHEVVISNSGCEEIEVACVVQDDGRDVNASSIAGRIDNDDGGGIGFHEEFDVPCHGVVHAVADGGRVAGDGGDIGDRVAGDGDVDGRINDDGGDIGFHEEFDVPCVVHVVADGGDIGDRVAGDVGVVCKEKEIPFVVEGDSKELEASTIAGITNGSGRDGDLSTANGVAGCYSNNVDSAGHEEVECVVVQVDDREVNASGILCDGISSGNGTGVSSVGIGNSSAGDDSGSGVFVSKGVGNGINKGVCSDDSASSCHGDQSRNNHYVSDQIYGDKDFEGDHDGLSEEGSGGTSVVVYPEIIVKALQSTDSAVAKENSQENHTNNDTSDCQVEDHLEIPKNYDENSGNSSFVDSVIENSVNDNHCCQDDSRVVDSRGVNNGSHDNQSEVNIHDDVTRSRDDVTRSEDDVTVIIDVNSINEDVIEEHVSNSTTQLNQEATADDGNNDICKGEFVEGDQNQDSKKSDVTVGPNDSDAKCDVIIMIDSADQNDDSIIYNDDDDKTISIGNNVRRKSSGSDSDHLRMLKNTTAADKLPSSPRNTEDPKATENTLGHLSDKNRTGLSLDERILNVNRSIDWVRSVIMEMRAQDLTLKIQFDGLRQEIRNLQHEYEHYGVDCDYYKDDELLNLEYLNYKTDGPKNHINTNAALREDNGYHSDTSSVSDSKDDGKGKVANVTKAKYLYEPIPSFPKVQTLTSSKCVFELVL